jgi:predicted RecB family nuclease
VEEIKTTLINDEVLKSFISCHRKAFLMERKLSQESAFREATEQNTFTTEYLGMKLVTKVDEFVKVDGKKAVVLDIHSKTIRERHKILASFLALILKLNGNEMPIFIRTLEGLKKIYPRKEKAEQVLLKVKEVFSKNQPPDPTFSFACRNCPFHNECVSFASKKGDISMINGIGEGRKKALQKAGYSTVEEVSQADPEILSKYMGINAKQAEKIVLQAKSVSTSEWFLIDKSKHIPRHIYEYFFDVEKAADETYLLGVLLKGKKENTYKYFLLLEGDWKSGWENFLKFIKLHPRAPIYHYDVFDKKVIEKFGALSGKSVKSILNRLEDLYDIITHTFVLPVRFYSLKDVARTVGFDWRMGDFNGYEAMKYLTEWKNKKNESLLKKIVTYNEDDCRALVAIKEKVSKILK